MSLFIDDGIHTSNKNTKKTMNARNAAINLEFLEIFAFLVFLDFVTLSPCPFSHRSPAFSLMTLRFA